MSHNVANVPTAVRNDYVGALTLVLENAPYGPNVEEAKVCNPASSPSAYEPGFSL